MYCIALHLIWHLMMETAVLCVSISCEYIIVVACVISPQHMLQEQNKPQESDSQSTPRVLAPTRIRLGKSAIQHGCGCQYRERQ